MSGKIFTVDECNQLTPLIETPFETEAMFQELLEKHPELLAGEQINPDRPCRWILISREMSVGIDGGWGSLDHLFIDQDAIPTFIEVKRSTDTRIRREVVAQMLDYAANGTRDWPLEKLQRLYLANVAGGSTPTLQDIGVDDEGVFWDRVSVNLRSGKVRLMFVADVIPDSLRAIIEFLNTQMRDTEVLGLEIKQFCAEDGQKTLVPNLLGRTANTIPPAGKKPYKSIEEFYASTRLR